MKWNSLTELNTILKGIEALTEGWYKESVYSCGVLGGLADASNMISEQYDTDGKAEAISRELKERMINSMENATQFRDSIMEQLSEIREATKEEEEATE